MQELYVGTLIVLGDNKRNGKECCCVYLGKEMCLCFREHMPIISQNTTQLIAPACQSSGQCRGGGGGAARSVWSTDVIPCVENLREITWRSLITGQQNFEMHFLRGGKKKVRLRGKSNWFCDWGGRCQDYCYARRGKRKNNDGFQRSSPVCQYWRLKGPGGKATEWLIPLENMCGCLLTNDARVTANEQIGLHVKSVIRLRIPT